jgi:hypothetical protein
MAIDRVMLMSPMRPYSSISNNLVRIGKEIKPAARIRTLPTKY